jgi:hypothetical protein
MKKVALAGIDFMFLWKASPACIEAACLYEYMCESQALRGVLCAASEVERKKASETPPGGPFFPWFSESEMVGLFVALQEAGYPKLWGELCGDCREQLEGLLGGAWSRRAVVGEEAFRPVVIAAGRAEFDLGENYWRMGQLEPGDLGLFKGREYRNSFVGFIRIGSGYTKREVLEGVKLELPKLGLAWKGGGANAKWRERLQWLVAMRIWKGEPDAWKRVKLVAKYCGYSGCKREIAAHKERCKQGLAGEPVGDDARAEMSRALSCARAFFHELFRGEEPLSY